MPATRTPRRSLRYIRLAAFLAAAPPDVVSMTLTLAEIEELVGSSLPESSRYASWWRDDPHKMHSRAWLTAGWTIASVDVEVPAVTWVREGAEEIRL